MTVAANIGVYAATAIGLNIVVGLAGLLDLGYVAFLGIGAFTAANLSPARPRRSSTSHLPFAAGHGDLARSSPACFGADRRLADAAGARRLPRDRHPRLRRDLRAHRAEQHRRPHRRLRTPSPASRRWSCSVRASPSRISGRRDPAPCGRPVLLADRAARRVRHAGLQPSSRTPGSGRAWIAIREDEDAARAMGIRTGPIKILAFLCGATLAGFAGRVLRAQDRHRVLRAASGSPSRCTLLAAVILGGMGTVPGAVLGASLLFVLPEKLREFAGLPAAPLRPRPHPDHAVPPAGPHARPAPAGRAGARPRGRAPTRWVDRREPGGGGRMSAPSAAPEAGRTGAGPILAAAGVTMRFGGLRALDDVSFDLMRGRDRRPDRPQRRRQDHVLQLPHRPVRPDRPARCRCRGERAAARTRAWSPGRASRGPSRTSGCSPT